MSGRPLLVLLALVGVFLGLGAFFLWDGGRGGNRTHPVGASGPTEARPREAVELVSASDEVEPRVEAPSQPEPEASQAETPGNEASAQESPALARLSGVLLRSSDRAPVSGVKLAFHFEGKSAITTTDDSGRFETEAVVPPGVVRAWYIGKSDEGGQRRELEPTLIAVPEGLEGGGAHQVELILKEPRVWLEAQVLRRGADPRARIQVACKSPGAHRSWTESTDSEGHARIGFSPIEAGDEVTLVARLENEMSRPVRVVHPWPDEVLLLELEPAGEIAVNVVDSSGQSIPNQFVSTLDRTCSGRTDSDGRVILGPLAAGPQTVRSEEATLDVVVPGGGLVEIELVLSARRRLVSGRVVDETGNGLEGVLVVVSHPMGSSSVSSDSDGRFSVLHEAGEVEGSVRVELGMGAGAARFQPEQVSVPPGTQDLLFQRLSTPRAVELSFALVDAHSRDSISEGSLFTYRARSPGWSEAYTAQDGLVVYCLVRPLDDVYFLARAPGYRDLSIGWRELPEAARNGELTTLALEPGFSRAVRVLDWNDEPVLGASLQVGDRFLARTNAEGRAWIELREAPAAVLVIADGYETAEWDSSLDEVEGIVYLDRLE